MNYDYFYEKLATHMHQNDIQNTGEFGLFYVIFFLSPFVWVLISPIVIFSGITLDLNYMAASSAAIMFIALWFSFMSLSLGPPLSYKAAFLVYERNSIDKTNKYSLDSSFKRSFEKLSLFSQIMWILAYWRYTQSLGIKQFVLDMWTNQLIPTKEHALISAEDEIEEAVTKQKQNKANYIYVG